MNNEKNLIVCLGIILGIILIPVLVIFQGWVLTVLWSWFVVPTFRLPELSIAVAIGLTLVVSMFKTYTINNDKNLTSEDKLVKAVAAVLVPLFVLFFGWIVHLFM
jgi:hypothetical protein